jgi:hypothetical protein
MAHEILPQHRPHEQLRTEAPKQREHSDKYVSAYVSSANHVDMSFSNPILQDSADHFLVGVDDFVVNLSHFSMLEYTGGFNTLLRIRRVGTGDEVMEEDSFLPGAALQAAATFSINKAYLSIAQILERMSEIARVMNEFIGGGLVNPGGGDALWNVPVDPHQTLNHLVVYVTNGGLLRFKATKLFWANFCIEVPAAQYRYLLFGKDAQYISINPEDGVLREPFRVVGQLPGIDIDLVANVFDPPIDIPNGYYTTVDLTANLLSFTGSVNVFFTLDRRVALELGCSLPIKNSPMVDHGQEAPDFVIGRFNLASETTFAANTNVGEASIDFKMGPRQLQGPKDRICYHHLGPQQKIQALRLRIWARVRTYNATTRKWGMQTIMCPVRESDFWHIKLHFRRK